MTRPIQALVAALALFVTACTSATETTTTAPPPSSATTTSAATSPAPETTVGASVAASTTTTAPATTTSVVAPSTTTAPSASPPQILVSNQSGVFLVGPDDKEVQLIEGQIAYAVDDTRGGVVFQLERGFGPFSTRVWWVPAGAGFADPILIAKPQTQTLALHDVVVDGDRTAVFYTRRDTPAGGSEIDYRATLRVFDLDSREVEELAPAGGFESGASPISFGGDWFVLNWGAEGFSWIEFLNRAGDPVEVAGNPLPSEVDAFDCASCAHHAELSPDGSRLAFVEAQERGDFFVPTLVITEMPDGDEIARVDLEDSLIHSLDFADGYVVISRLTNDFSTFRTPLVVDFNQSPPTVTEVAVAGLGRIVRAPIEFDEVVLAPVTDG